jgi:hypothetical protein
MAWMRSEMSSVDWAVSRASGSTSPARAAALA